MTTFKVLGLIMISIFLGGMWSSYVLYDKESRGEEVKYPAILYFMFACIMAAIPLFGIAFLIWG